MTESKCTRPYEIELTNEEWFCGLSTKKKAKFFKDISEKCLNCGSAIDYDEIGECPFGRCRTGLNEYEDWLKEKHTMANICPICNNELLQFGKDFYVCEVCETYFDKNENIVLTEQEWLQTATTEQLAEWIAKCIKDTIILTHGNRKYTDNIVSTKWWEEWLKQPHTERR